MYQKHNKITDSTLFDKLIDDAPEVTFEKEIKHLYTIEEFEQSIKNDLSNLLNTRVATLWNIYSTSAPTPYSYGINISEAISGENIFDVAALEEQIEKIIKLFEPRLLSPRVHINNIDPLPATLLLNIEANIMIKKQRVKISFPLVIKND